jgi:pilus assembly protein CpaE
MPKGIKTCLFNAEEGFSAELRKMLQTIGGVKIVAEVADPNMLEECLRRFHSHVALVNLDPNPEEYLKVTNEVASKLPNVAVFAFSGKEDARLILNALRAGVREFMTKPVNPEELQTAFDKISQQVSTVSAGKVIAVMGASGGCGATVITCNLAVELAALTEKEVAIIDLDFPFGAVANYFDVKPQYTIAELAATEKLEQGMLEGVFVRHPSKVAILARPARLEDGYAVSAERVAGIISMVAELFETVIIDIPPRFDSLGLSVLDQLDTLILNVELSVPSIRNAERIWNSLSRNGFPSERLKIVVNRLKDGEDLSLKPQHVEQVLDQKVFQSIPSDYNTVKTAINYGQPLAQEAPSSPVRIKIADLAKKMIAEQSKSGKQTAESEEEETKQAGVFARMWSF